MAKFWGKVALPVIAAVAGAASSYLFTTYEKALEDARRQRTEAYLNFLKAAEGDDRPTKIYTRDAVLAFGSSTVISAMAKAYRAEALLLAGNKLNEIKAHVQDSSTTTPWVQTLQHIRNEYNSDDPVSDQDVLTLMCPDPRYTCYQVWHSDHLFKSSTQ